MSAFDRTERLIGTAALDKLKAAKVAVFGLGGVGSYVVEALVRSGVGSLYLIDFDTVSETNLNRQLCALTSTIGKLKTEVTAARAADVNPLCNITCFNIRYDLETADNVDVSDCDYVVDAIDSVPSKVLLITRCKAANVPVISSMGAGNKLNPTAFKVADVSKTNTCPLARVMRRKLKEVGIEHVKTVFSDELPKGGDSAERAPASIAFVPSVAGLIIAGEVIKDLTNIND